MTPTQKSLLQKFAYIRNSSSSRRRRSRRRKKKKKKHKHKQQQKKQQQKKPDEKSFRILVANRLLAKFGSIKLWPWKKKGTNQNHTRTCKPRPCTTPESFPSRD
jgi:hypothetical protein